MPGYNDTGLGYGDGRGPDTTWGHKYCHCTVLYCTVLYCTVLYCTVCVFRYCHCPPGGGGLFGSPTRVQCSCFNTEAAAVFCQNRNYYCESSKHLGRSYSDDEREKLVCKVSCDWSMEAKLVILANHTPANKFTY